MSALVTPFFCRGYSYSHVFLLDDWRSILDLAVLLECCSLSFCFVFESCRWRKNWFAPRWFPLILNFAQFDFPSISWLWSLNIFSYFCRFFMAPRELLEFFVSLTSALDNLHWFPRWLLWVFSAKYLWKLFPTILRFIVEELWNHPPMTTLLFLSLLAWSSFASVWPDFNPLKVFLDLQVLVWSHIRSSLVRMEPLLDSILPEVGSSMEP